MSRFLIELSASCWSRSRPDLIADGITPGALRGPSWRRTSTGFYRPTIEPASGPTSTTQRIVDAAPLVPPGGAIGGWASAYVHGAEWLDGRGARNHVSRVRVLLGSTVDRMPSDPRYYRGLLESDEIQLVHGLPVTSLSRTAFDCARWTRTLADAVVNLDAMLRFTTLTLSDLGDWLPRVRGWRGVRRVRAALALADGRIRSPWESRLRVLYADEAGFAVPLVNAPIVDNHTGLVVAEVDLLDVEAGLVLEYDGEYHLDRGQAHADNLREELLESLNLVVCRVDVLDFADHRSLIRRIVASRQHGQLRDRRRDRWSVAADRVDRVDRVA